ncbi:ADP-ribosyl-[dinitrogen reductase] glycohydrolase [Purpureocillium lavendulum]|uniref:ADP-ribosyl-[dinitrogen reductase] glycohydrolase n=1 Tax=Purpureocillium lavendulum TaxID=1247861 RepID=A0AB34FLG8_9HYPO|nr:ADP-ribosyl-[dinitrogen reductase] glycohydrolase [Purpureocillium lavendulum]
MKSVTYLCSLLSVLPVAFGLVAPRDGYKVVLPTWTFQVTPGGETVVLNGTIQQARAELLKRNPNWDSDFPRNETKRLVDRTIGPNSRFNCEPRWGYGGAGMIQELISELDRADGIPVLPHGPGTCAKVSCKWDTAIWWCNDNRYLWVLESGGYTKIANGASFIFQHCYHGGKDAQIAGQVFDKDNWNVIVCGGDC